VEEENHSIDDRIVGPYNIDVYIIGAILIVGFADHLKAKVFKPKEH